MGMYTELIFGCSLKQDTPKEVIDTMYYLLGAKEIENPVFQTKYYKNGYVFFNCGSYYFGVNKSVCRIWLDEISESYHVSIRFNTKNYENDIESFLAWIKPFIDSGSGDRDMYAITIYEEDEEPTIYYLKDKE